MPGAGVEHAGEGDVWRIDRRAVAFSYPSAALCPASLCGKMLILDLVIVIGFFHCALSFHSVLHHGRKLRPKTSVA